MNLITPEAGAEQDVLFNKPASADGGHHLGKILTL